ncbi:MAG: 3-deoxy-manno-octulosonate cytidylyltransferase [Piscirickettsiaceae bacterium]|nr:3-deoxy-manno-octulosonate cytidylyltransferase [Piscirickettsiaceae bacterium]
MQNCECHFRIIIPARYNSKRLPGKPLINIAGKPMIQHVFEHAQASRAYEVIIATDDIRIEKMAHNFGADVCMTSSQHASGTDRLSEVVYLRNFNDDDIIVNMQGDEPYLPSSLIDQVADDLNYHHNVDIATLYSKITKKKQIFDPDIVKVVIDINGYAIYFSRAPIPWMQDNFHQNYSSPSELPQYKHIGLYGYRAKFLKNYSKLKPCILEKYESLEQLRAIFYGKKIHLSMAQVYAGHGVDTKNDLIKMQKLLTTDHIGN